MSVSLAYRTRRTGLATLCALLVAAGMAVSPARAQQATDTATPAPAAQPTQQAPSDDLRLAAVGYRLAQGNAQMCDRPQMLTGLMLHDVASYAPADRANVQRVHNLTQGFGILSIVPGSAAARAGLQRGDEIVAVGDTDLTQFETASIGARPTYDRVEHAVARLGTALQTGPASLSVRRGGNVVTITLAADHGCGGEFVVMPSRALNAWSDGHYVAVTTRMMSFAENDDQLAFVVAHEMAHNILGHNGESTSSSLFPAARDGRRPSAKQRELDADHLAVTIMAASRFNLAEAGAFLGRTRRARWMDVPLSHPGIGRRMEMVAQAIAALPAPQTAPAVIQVAANTPATAPMLQLTAVDWTAAIPAADPYKLRLDMAPTAMLDDHLGGSALLGTFTTLRSR